MRENLTKPCLDCSKPILNQSLLRCRNCWRLSLGDPKTRFYGKVNKTDGCWLWTASKSKGGYGWFYLNGKNMFSNRAAWILENGPIPKGLWVLHRCDVRLCVRISHLFLGTPADNIKDMVEKGRHAHEETHKLSKLDWKKVFKIRKMYATDKYSRKELAKIFDISIYAIDDVIYRYNWKSK